MTNLAQRTGLEILRAAPGVTRLSDTERAQMTASCRDTDRIPKVAGAGSLRQLPDGRGVQVMHNGVLVEAGGYFGAWMAYVIRELRGHHEPQEELVFHELVQRVRPGGTMVELGCFWAYYSLWFQHAVPAARNACYEPDPRNLALGMRNAELNGAAIDFRPALAGSRHGDLLPFLPESGGEELLVPVVSVDGLMAERGWERLDLLHVDVQGAELETLLGARETIRAGKLRFVVVSTHHWSISGRADLHGECLRLLGAYGAHVITSHTVAESFSGDGLIAASFDHQDADFVLQTSLNHTDRSLFRPYEEDLAILLASLS